MEKNDQEKNGQVKIGMYIEQYKILKMSRF